MSLAMRKVIKKLTSDKKKFSLMLGLFAVMLLLWGRLILKQIPRTASARLATENLTSSDKKGELDDSTPIKRKMPQTIYVDLPTKLTHNLFAFVPDVYPMIKQPVKLSEPVGKSTEESTDGELGQDQILKLLAGLKLQSTMLGMQPRAVINGQVLMPGEQINGLTLKKVLPSAVILQIAHKQVRLAM